MKHSEDTLDYIQKGRPTRRYHNLPMHDYQRVDAHSYGVAQLVRFLLGPTAEPMRLARLLCAALDHDLPEQVTGDIPAPTKRALPPQARTALDLMEREAADPHGMGRFMFLDDEDTRILKIADAAEGILHCIEERLMGNRRIRVVFLKFWSYLTKLDFREMSPVLYSYLTTQWKIANEGEW